MKTTTHLRWLALAVGAVVLQACQADVTKRYHSAAEMRQGLLTVQDALERESPSS